MQAERWNPLRTPSRILGNNIVCRVCGEGIPCLLCGFGTRQNLRSQLSISKGSLHLFSHGDFALCPLNDRRERLTEGIRQGFRLA